MRIVFVGLAFVLALSPDAVAQDEQADAPTASLRPHIDPPRIAGKDNAAFEYLKIWDSFTGRDLEYFTQHYLWFPVNHPYRKALAVENDTDEKQHEFLSQHADAVAQLMHAAAMSDCVWNAARGEESAQFFEVPWHMSWLRSTSWILAADAERCINEKHANAAVDRIIALINLTRQAREGQFFFLASVSSQWCHAALVLTQQLKDEGQLTPNLARPILVALKTLPSDDPLGQCVCLETEQRRAIELFRARYTGAAAGARFISDYGGRLTSYALINPAWSMNEEQFQVQLRRYDAYLSKVAAIWRKADDVGMSELADEVMEGQYGVVTPFARKPGLFYYAQMKEFRDRLTTTERMLSGLIESNAAPAVQANPVSGPHGTR